MGSQVKVEGVVEKDRRVIKDIQVNQELMDFQAYMERL
jgi:hypothetical protein